MPAPVTRIFSDLHYGDASSRIRHLNQLRPLLDGIGRLVLNGDTFDSRPGPRPRHTAERRAEVEAFFGEQTAAVTFITGNHDPDFSPHHSADLAGGDVFATHGDILFDTIVPWGRDATMIHRLISSELARLAPADRLKLVDRFSIWRRVAASVPQRHQSEPRGPRYWLGFLADTMWPADRVLRIFKAWREEFPRAGELAGRHRPQAKFVLLGHTHRPRVRRGPSGLTFINTGSFCAPFGGCLVDLLPGQLVVRKVKLRRGEFRAGSVLAEFPLANA